MKSATRQVPESEASAERRQEFFYFNIEEAHLVAGKRTVGFFFFNIDFYLVRGNFLYGGGRALADKKFIITPNYRDPLSRSKWLVHRQGDDPRKAQAVETVLAIGVKFVAEPVVGWGAGGRVVAHCQEALRWSLAQPSYAQDSPVWFEIYRFLDIRGREVTGCDYLYLGRFGVDGGGLKFL